MAADHGSTPAAWTTVTVIIVGFLLGSFALILGEGAWVIVAGGVVVAGGIVGKVMQLMGLGKPSRPAAPRAGVAAPAGEERHGAGDVEPQGAL